MTDHFRAMFEGLKQAAEGLQLTSRALVATADAAIQARDEHEDLRETVRRLEALVLELVERDKRRP